TGRQVEGDGDAALHVDRASPPQLLGAVGARLPAGGQVVADRHRVEVTGDDDARVPAQVRAGDHRVAVAQHLQVLERPQRTLDGVRERTLVTADALDVAHRLGER